MSDLGLASRLGTRTRAGQQSPIFHLCTSSLTTYPYPLAATNYSIWTLFGTSFTILNFLCQLVWADPCLTTIFCVLQYIQFVFSVLRQCPAHILRCHLNSRHLNQVCSISLWLTEVFTMPSTRLFIIDVGGLIQSLSLNEGITSFYQRSKAWHQAAVAIYLTNQLNVPSDATLLSEQFRDNVGPQSNVLIRKCGTFYNWRGCVHSGSLNNGSTISSSPSHHIETPLPSPISRYRLCYVARSKWNLFSSSQLAQNFTN